MIVQSNHSYILYKNPVQWNPDLKWSFFSHFAVTQTVILLPDFSNYPILKPIVVPLGGLKGFQYWLLSFLAFAYKIT